MSTNQRGQVAVTAQRANAIYVRTSVADADGAAQLHQLRHAAKARGWVAWREYVDIGQSGAKASRPALDDLRGAVKRGEVEVCMSAALDRLGRSLRDLILLLDELAAGGCAIITLREGIDLTTPVGRLTMQILGAIGEFERALIRERIRNGIEKVKATGRSRSGRSLGRPRRAVDVDRVRELRAKGRSWREIAVALKAPRRTLERAFAAAAQNPLRNRRRAPLGSAPPELVENDPRQNLKVVRPRLRRIGSAKRKGSLAIDSASDELPVRDPATRPRALQGHEVGDRSALRPQRLVRRQHPARGRVR